MTILLIVILVILLMGGIPAWRVREDYGPAPMGIVSVLLLIVLIVLILRII